MLGVRAGWGAVFVTVDQDRILGGDLVPQPDRPSAPPVQAWQHDLVAGCKENRAEHGHWLARLAWPAHATQFRRTVYTYLARQVSAGEMISYGALAAAIGHPGAARAVGSAMRHNQFPLLIPCHRVGKSDGRLGGFQGGRAGGEDLKAALLRSEGYQLPV